MDDQGRSANLNQILEKISNLAKSGQPSQAYSQYVDKLIDQKGFLDITPEVKAEIKKDVLRRLDDFIAARVIAGLSDQDVQTFEKMLKEGKTEVEIQKFVTERIPNFVDFLTNVLLEFKGVYLGDIQSPMFIKVGEEKAEAGSNISSKQHRMPPPAPVYPTKNSDLSKLN